MTQAIAILLDRAADLDTDLGEMALSPREAEALGLDDYGDANA